VLNGKTRGKELKRAKQAGQQRASGSDCNLAVNRHYHPVISTIVTYLKPSAQRNETETKIKYM